MWKFLGIFATDPEATPKINSSNKLCFSFGVIVEYYRANCVQPHDQNISCTADGGAGEGIIFGLTFGLEVSHRRVSPRSRFPGVSQSHHAQLHGLLEGAA